MESLPVNRVFRLAIAASALLATFAAGYCLHGWRHRALGSAQLEDAVLELSFSEVANAKSRLRDLFCEFTNHVMEQHIFAGSTLRDPNCLDRIARELRDGIVMFQGTEQELWLTRDLLWILKMRQARPRRHRRSALPAPVDDKAHCGIARRAD